MRTSMLSLTFVFLCLASFSLSCGCGDDDDSADDGDDDAMDDDAVDDDEPGGRLPVTLPNLYDAGWSANEKNIRVFDERQAQVE